MGKTRAELVKMYEELAKLSNEKNETYTNKNKIENDIDIQEKTIERLAGDEKLLKDEEIDIPKRKKEYDQKLKSMVEEKINREYHNEDVQILPENIDEVINNYEKYKDIFEKRMKEKGKEDEVKKYKEERELGIQKEKEYQTTVNKRYYPKDADAFLSQSDEEKADTITLLNRAFERKNKTFSLDEIKMLREKSQNTKAEYDNKKAAMEKWLEMEKIKHDISTDILEKNKFEAIKDESAKNIIKAQLGDLINSAKIDNIPSIERYWEEGQLVKRFKEDIEIESNSKIFKASENIEKVKTKEDEELLRNAIKFHYIEKNGANFEEKQVDEVINGYNEAKNELDRLVARKERVNSNISSYKTQKEIKVEREDYEKLVSQKSIINQYGDKVANKLTNSLEEFIDAENEKELIIEKLNKFDGKIDNEQMPTTFTELSKLKGADYELACIRINKMLSSIPQEKRYDEIIRGNITVKSLDEYFAMTQIPKPSEEEKKIMVATKRVIKEWIKEQNALKPVTIEKSDEIKQLKDDLYKAIDRGNAADKAIQDVIKEYKKIGENVLKEDAKNLEVEIKKAQEVLNSKQDNIKTIVQNAKNLQQEKVNNAKVKYEINNGLHEINKEKLEAIIKQNNKIKPEYSNEAKDELKELENKAKEAKENQENSEKEINDILKDINKKIDNTKSQQKNYKEQDNNYKEEKNKRDAEQNSRRKNIEKAVIDTNKEAKELSNSINKAVKDNMKEIRNAAKKERRNNLIKKAILVKINDLMGSLDKNIYNLLEGIEIGKIEGQRNELEQKVAEEHAEFVKNSNALTSISRQMDDYNKENNNEKYIEEKKKHDVIQKSMKEHEKKRDEFQKELDDFRVKEHVLIQKKMEEVKKQFEKEPKFNIADEQKIAQIKKEAFEAVAKENKDLKFIADAKNDITMEEIKAIVDEDEQSKQELQNHLDEIEKIGDKLSNLLKPSNIVTMNYVIKGIQLVANFAIGKINKANGFEDPIEKIDVDKTLNDVEESLTAESKPEISTVDQLLKVTRLAYDKVGKPIVNIVKEASEDTKKKFINSDILYDAVKSDDKAFEEYIENTNSKEQKTFLDIKLEMRDSDLEKQLVNNKQEMELVGKAKKNVQNEIEKNKDALKNAEDIDKAKGEELEQKLQEMENAKKEFNMDFANKVIASAKEDKKNVPVTFNRDEVIKARENDTDFSFLSKLTGVELNQNSEMKDVIDAMSKVYINGMNSFAYFDLHKDCTMVLNAADNEAKEAAHKNFMKHVLECGDSIQDGLKAPFDKDVKGPLVGQIIAVENDSMLLSAVTLKSDLESDKAAVSDFNKINKLMNSEFNEMRVETAKNTIEKDKEKKRAEKMAQKQKNNEKDKDDLLSKAVFKSRDVVFGK